MVSDPEKEKAIATIFNEGYEAGLKSVNRESKKNEAIGCCVVASVLSFSLTLGVGVAPVWGFVLFGTFSLICGITIITKK